MDSLPWLLLIVVAFCDFSSCQVTHCTEETAADECWACGEGDDDQITITCPQGALIEIDQVFTMYAAALAATCDMAVVCNSTESGRMAAQHCPGHTTCTINVSGFSMQAPFLSCPFPSDLLKATVYFRCVPAALEEPEQPDVESSEAPTLSAPADTPTATNHSGLVYCTEETAPGQCWACGEDDDDQINITCSAGHMIRIDLVFAMYANVNQATCDMEPHCNSTESGHAAEQACTGRSTCVINVSGHSMTPPMPPTCPLPSDLIRAVVDFTCLLPSTAGPASSTTPTANTHSTPTPPSSTITTRQSEESTEGSGEGGEMPRDRLIIIVVVSAFAFILLVVLVNLAICKAISRPPSSLHYTEDCPSAEVMVGPNAHTKDGSVYGVTFGGPCENDTVRTGRADSVSWQGIHA